MRQGENSREYLFILVIADKELAKERKDVWRGLVRTRRMQDHLLKEQF